MKREAVDRELWWDWKPGQRVMTKEGFPGVVTAVEDGGIPGSEKYIVLLDSGMGGGEYGTSELSTLGDASRSAACVDCGGPKRGQITERCPSCTGLKLAQDGQALASEDYPELTEILFDRPPLEREHMGHEGAKAPTLCPECGSDAIEPSSGLVSYEGEDGWVDLWKCYSCGHAFEQRTRRKSGSDYPKEGAAEAAKTADGWENFVNKHLLQNVPFEQGRAHSYDWCKFRRDSHCWYPKSLDAEATKKAGYAVWTPVDRGYCPRIDWDGPRGQKACPLGDPGPHSGDPQAEIEATVPWNEGGQHGGIPIQGVKVESGVEHHITRSERPYTWGYPDKQTTTYYAAECSCGKFSVDTGNRKRTENAINNHFRKVKESATGRELAQQSQDRARAAAKPDGTCGICDKGTLSRRETKTTVVYRCPWCGAGWADRK